LNKEEKRKYWDELQGLRAESEALMTLIQQVGQQQQLRLNRANQLQGSMDTLTGILDGWEPEPMPKSASEVPPEKLPK